MTIYLSAPPDPFSSFERFSCDYFRRPAPQDDQAAKAFPTAQVFLTLSKVKHLSISYLRLVSNLKFTPFIHLWNLRRMVWFPSKTPRKSSPIQPPNEQIPYLPPGFWGDVYWICSAKPYPVRSVFKLIRIEYHCSPAG